MNSLFENTVTRISPLIPEIFTHTAHILVVLLEYKDVKVSLQMKSKS